MKQSIRSRHSATASVASGHHKWVDWQLNLEQASDESVNSMLAITNTEENSSSFQKVAASMPKQEGPKGSIITLGNTTVPIEPTDDVQNQLGKQLKCETRCKPVVEKKADDRVDNRNIFSEDLQI